jgi:hypothetical protein
MWHCARTFTQHLPPVLYDQRKWHRTGLVTGSANCRGASRSDWGNQRSREGRNIRGHSSRSSNQGKRGGILTLHWPQQLFILPGMDRTLDKRCTGIGAARVSYPARHRRPSCLPAMQPRPPTISTIWNSVHAKDNRAPLRFPAQLRKSEPRQ